MVHVLVNLAGSSVLLQESSQHPLSSHPQNLDRHSGVLGTSSLAETLVSALALLLVVTSHSRLGVDGDLLSHDQTVLLELSDGSSRVGQGDLVGFVRVDPDLLLSALQHGSGEPLLMSKLGH